MLARVVPADGRSARLRRRPARDRSPSWPSAGRTSSTCTGSTRTSRCSRRRSSARCSTGSRVTRGGRPSPNSGAARQTCRRHRSGAARALGGDERARAREIDLLRYQLDRDRRRAAIGEPDEDERLAARGGDPRRRRGAPRRAGRPRTSALEGAAEDASGARSAALAGRAPFAEIAGRLQSLQAEIAEAAHDVRASRSSRSSPIRERLAEVQARRARSARDHAQVRRRRSPTSRVRGRGPCSARRSRIARRARRRAGSRRAPRSARRGGRAAALTAARRAAAGPLGRRGDRAPPPARDAVGELRGGGGARPSLTDDGADDVIFLLAANPGEPARPLARAASGGELSRAMLALRVVLSEAPPTLVFDEVDAGIGGEAGAAVGSSARRRWEVNTKCSA